jgi:hypothetical protein
MGVKFTITIPIWLDKLFAWPVLIYRKWKYGYTYRKISLGQGKFTIVDPQDFYRFNVFNWCPRQNGTNTYAIRPITTLSKRVTVVSLHREIMGHPKGLVIDHRNCNALDNRRANLREATQAQNMCNCRKRPNTSSRFRGVYFYKRDNKWAARLQQFGKVFWLGSFKSEIDAARAYDKAARKYHKEFAKLNFPEEIERSPRRLNSRLANWLGANLNFPEEKATTKTQRHQDLRWNKEHRTENAEGKIEERLPRRPDTQSEATSPLRKSGLLAMTCVFVRHGQSSNGKLAE